MNAALLLEPFGYAYMSHAMWVAALIGGVCAFLSCFLMLKGWSLIGDALSHSIVPGVAGAYMLGLPFSAGAFFAALLAAGSMMFLNQRTPLKQDVVIGLIFSAFFGLGLFMISVSPVAVNVQTIVQGNLLAIGPDDTRQLLLICGITLLVLMLKWKDLLAMFFDEPHARSIGLHAGSLKVLFFSVLAASTVAAMQAVGAFLVIALIVTPGATAYLLSDRFSRVILIAITIGVISSALGVYLSYFLNGATGAIIVLLQASIFALAFVLAPTHGLLAARRRRRAGLQAGGSASIPAEYTDSPDRSRHADDTGTGLPSAPPREGARR
ncbi:MAG: metal ABC transporter permease [Lautropia sp.]|nr:metal ABC transporter permease [Lautropia sp.]